MNGGQPVRTFLHFVNKGGQHVSRCLGMLILAGLFLVSATLAEPLTLHVRQAAVGHDQSGRVAIDVRVTNPQELGRLTSENLGRMMEVRIDGKTVFSPVIQTPIIGGRFQFTGVLSDDQARELADRLSKGESVVQVEIIDR
jgi:SecDF, P1 head subdomain